MSQKFFPIGIDKAGRDTGPLYHLQNNLSPGLALNTFKNVGKNPLKNGITVFAGGVPLYKNGKLVGGLGISGDGIDQDDLIAAGGSRRYQAPLGIRSDALDEKDVADFITGRVQRIASLFKIDEDVLVPQARDLLDRTFDFRLPYLKFPRNPEV
jgi:hypothetical protein